MKIIKLTDSLFAFETDEFEISVMDWKQLITTLDDIAVHFEEPIGYTIEQIAMLKLGGSLKI